MLLFNQDNGDTIYFLFANVLVLKAMHDRGYEVKNVLYSEPILSDCLDIIFDKVEWENAEAPEKYARLIEKYDEDSEEYAFLADFLERRHYVLRLYLNDLKEVWPRLAPEQIARLAEIIGRVTVDPAGELIDYFPEYGYYDWRWLKENGAAVGIEVGFFDLPQYQEFPVPSLEIFAFLKFIDAVKLIRKELAECTNPAA